MGRMKKNEREGGTGWGEGEDFHKVVHKGGQCTKMLNDTFLTGGKTCFGTAKSEGPDVRRGNSFSSRDSWNEVRTPSRDDVPKAHGMANRQFTQEKELQEHARGLRKYRSSIPAGNHGTFQTGRWSLDKFNRIMLLYYSPCTRS